MGQYDSIYSRWSVKKYLEETLYIGVIEEVKNIIKDPKRLYEDIGCSIHLVEDGKKFQNILKGRFFGFGKIKAPYYLVITSEKKDNYLENVGYIAEDIILRLTDLKLGTCWVSSIPSRDNIESFISIKENEEAVLIIPFGIIKSATRSKSFFERYQIEEIIVGSIGNKWKNIMECVRRAPSSFNSQPWKFYKVDNRIDVYRKTSSSKNHKEEKLNKIDMGVAICHVDVGAEYYDKEIEFENLSIDNKEDEIYTISILEK